MQELRDDPVYEGVETSHLLEALDAAMQIQKRKVIVGPTDSVGIILFNTVRKRILQSSSYNPRDRPKHTTSRKLGPK
jgi:hypothetical protein